MSAQDVIIGTRALHLKQLKLQIAALKAENTRLREQNDELANHFDLAMAAAVDLRALPPGGKMVVVDGWNLVLGAQKTARTPEELVGRAREYLSAHPCDCVWIVFDGPRENVVNEGRLRVSYTGGTGAHRADRFIVDFLRMARYCGLADKIEVRSADKDLLKNIKRISTVQ